MRDIRFDHYVWRFSKELSLDQTSTDHARTILADFESELLEEMVEWLEKYKFGEIKIAKDAINSAPFFIIPPRDLQALKRGEMPG